MGPSSHVARKGIKKTPHAPVNSNAFSAYQTGEGLYKTGKVAGGGKFERGTGDKKGSGQV